MKQPSLQQRFFRGFVFLSLFLPTHNVTLIKQSTRTRDTALAPNSSHELAVEFLQLWSGINNLERQATQRYSDHIIVVDLHGNTV